MNSFVLKIARFRVLIVVFLLLVFNSEGLTAQNEISDSVLVIPVKYSVDQQKTSIPVDTYPVDIIVFKAGEKINYYKVDGKKQHGRINKIGSNYLIIDSLKVNLSEIMRVYYVRLVNPAFILSAEDYKIYFEKIVLENQKYYKGKPIQSESMSQIATNDSILVIATQLPVGAGTVGNIPMEPGPKNYITYEAGNKIVYYKKDGIKKKGTIYKVGADYLIIESEKIPIIEIRRLGKVLLIYNALIVSKNDYRNMQLGLYHYKMNADSNNTEKQRGIKYEHRKAKSFGRRNKEYLYPHSITFNIFEPLDNQATLTYSYRINEHLGVDISPGFYFKTEERVQTIPNITYEQSHPGFNYSKNEFRGFQLNPGLKLYFPRKPNRYFEFLWLNRYIYYNHERVPVYYFYDLYSSMAEQSERTYVTGFNIIYGWQTTIRKHVTLDFFFGLGAINRRAKIIEYKGGFHPNETVSYPNTHYLSGMFFSFQGGVKIGLRFGKRKTKPSLQ